jgi:hypothetical protein
VDKLALVQSAELGQLLLPLAQGWLRQGADGPLQDLLLTSRPWGFELGRVQAPTLLVRGCQDGCVTERMVSAGAAAAAAENAAAALAGGSVQAARCLCPGAPLAGVLLPAVVWGPAAALLRAAACRLQVGWLQQRIAGCRVLQARGEGHLSLLLNSAGQIFSAALELLEDRRGQAGERAPRELAPGAAHAAALAPRAEGAAAGSARR